MNAARVELMASAAGKIGGVTWHHLFLLATDASGAQSYLRAGPQSLPATQLTGRQTEHGDALEDYEPPATGPYGVITFTTGSYEPGGVDFDPVAANAVLATGDAAAVLWNKLKAASHAVHEEAIPYDPIGKGANWAAMEVLRRCGVEPRLPPKRWAPGAGAWAADAEQEAVTRRLGQPVVI